MNGTESGIGTLTKPMAVKITVELVTEEGEMDALVEAISDFSVQFGLRIAKRNCFYRELSVKEIEP